MSSSLSKLALLKAKVAAVNPVTSPLQLESPAAVSSSNSNQIPSDDEKTVQTNCNSNLSGSSGPDNTGTKASDVGNGSSIEKSTPSNSLSSSEGEVSFEHLQFLSKLSELEGMLLAAHPSMPTLLRDIHTQLSKDPEIVTLLSEDQIGVIVNGLKKQTQTELSGTALKAASKTKKLSLSSDMF